MLMKYRWGYVCDAGTWGVEEADVVCKQLGFSRGVQKTTQGLVHGKVTEMACANACVWTSTVMLNVKVEEGLRATERVACSGSESALDECVIEGMGEGGSCKLEEDIVSISCVPDSWAACEVRCKRTNVRTNSTLFPLSLVSCPGPTPATASIPL